MKEAIVFVESSGSGAGEATALAARELGFVPIVLGRDLTTYPFLAELSITSLRADTKSQDALLETCLQLGQDYKLAGVGTTAEYYAEIAASIAKQLQLPGPNPESVTTCREKDRMRAALQKTNLNPRYYLVETPEEAAAATESLGPPVIIKPTILSGSALVQLCKDVDDACQYARKLLQVEFIDGFDMPRHILVEEYVDGPEFSVEVFNGESLGVTKKKLGPPPFFVEIGHDFPADLDDYSWNAVTEAALEAAAAIGLLWGPAHIDVKLGSKGPRIIEVNPRMAGGRIPYLIKYATGGDFASAYVSGLTGRSSKLERTRRASASIRFVTVPGNGIFNGVTGLEAARRMDGVLDFKMTGQIGKNYKLRCSNGDRIGYVIAVGDCIRESATRAETALEYVRLLWDFEPSRGAPVTSTV